MTAVLGLARLCKHLWQTLLVNLVDAMSTENRDRVPKTLLIVHMDAIGDYVVFRNFLREVRESTPYNGFRITLCGNSQYRELAEALDGDVVDDFIWLDRHRFRHDLRYRATQIKMISGRGFAVAINPTSSRVYYWGDTIVRACGATERIGCVGDLTNCQWWQKKLSDRYYTRLVASPAGYLFEFDRIKRFFSDVLNREILMTRPLITIGQSKSPVDVEGGYAVIFPGGSVAFKHWNAVKYAEVADYLGGAYGLTVVLAGGAADSLMARQISDRVKSCRCLDLTGKTSLLELVELIAGSRLLVSNETSAVHIAVSVGTDTVCIASGHQFGRFYPYPEDVFDRIRYVYPPELMDSHSDIPRLWAKYYHSAGLDVNTITATQVIRQIGVLMTGSSV